jgi:hypothetical protein
MARGGKQKKRAAGGKAGGFSSLQGAFALVIVSTILLVVRNAGGGGAFHGHIAHAPDPLIRQLEKQNIALAAQVKLLGEAQNKPKPSALREAPVLKKLQSENQELKEQVRGLQKRLLVAGAEAGSAAEVTPAVPAVAEIVPAETKNGINEVKLPWNGPKISKSTISSAQQAMNTEFIRAPWLESRGITSCQFLQNTFQVIPGYAWFNLAESPTSLQWWIDQGCDNQLGVPSLDLSEKSLETAAKRLLAEVSWDDLEDLGLHLSKVNQDQHNVPIKSKLGPAFYSYISEMAGIQMRDGAQKAFLDECVKYKHEYNVWTDRATAGNDWHFHFGGQYAPVDAEVLYCQIRINKPQLMIEVGSGATTKIAVEALEKNRIEGDPYQFIAIDPMPREAADWTSSFEHVTFLQGGIEQVDSRIFEYLGQNDILLIDSSHMFKINGDVSGIITHYPTYELTYQRRFSSSFWRFCRG